MVQMYGIKVMMAKLVGFDTAVMSFTVVYFSNAALHSAIANDFPEAARILIEAGCDVDLPENEGNTPLHKATQKDFPVCCELLRSYGANQWIRNDAGKTAVDIARDNDFQECLDALVRSVLCYF